MCVAYFRAAGNVLALSKWTLQSRSFLYSACILNGYKLWPQNIMSSSASNRSYQPFGTIESHSP